MEDIDTVMARNVSGKLTREFESICTDDAEKSGKKRNGVEKKKRKRIHFIVPGASFLLRTENICIGRRFYVHGK